MERMNEREKERGRERKGRERKEMRERESKSKPFNINLIFVLLFLKSHLNWRLIQDAEVNVCRGQWKVIRHDLFTLLNQAKPSIFFKPLFN